MEKTELAKHMALLFLFLFFFLKVQAASGQYLQPSSCDKIQNIRHPFYLGTENKRCSEHTLSCENNVTILELFHGKYAVESINYANKTIRVTDPDVHNNSCSSRPRHSLGFYNFSHGDLYRVLMGWDQTTFERISLVKSVIFLSCDGPVESPLYVDAKSCADKNYSYVLVDGSLSGDYLPDSCRIELMAFVLRDAKIRGRGVSFADIHIALL